ncbi:hypothetical protein A2W67_03190 [Candidatus Nomurabacteria bacterium RIFCSPLOWO2_02_40_28]|nr:MAG: hypothetical protein UU07_C0047G0009 [Parcubacteria group bacterium GW2011_GWF1_40_5]OGI74082.1 MAG: hypothetical protein A2W50_02670 [Candidatus Nomurabacteria bacterium RIFCSPHIGHO2_02_40_30]OGI79651.1 MAG: hypothetical protein A2W43_01140 [Candidatus Nomurabacteria bacterium RIFCSPHIGHO2_12_40_11]OGI83706.1 MAG: hypothetical protein A3E33_02950 [Candidatus Nomurabacteria bacterium RIFCSPHIGHO2_12_FULL_40_77]OGI96278.1 MAG: hypothetical protein A2W67_03190 [Candidatus Nomurabacteria b
MAEKAAGFVIQVGYLDFISRSRKPIHKKNRKSSSGIERAWVHNLKTVMEGNVGSFSKVTIYPAVYDPDLDRTVVTGKGVSYDEFVKTAQGVTSALV